MPLESIESASIRVRVLDVAAARDKIAQGVPLTYADYGVDRLSADGETWIRQPMVRNVSFSVGVDHPVATWNVDFAESPE